MPAQLKLKVFQNGDDALLVWNFEGTPGDDSLQECRGFAVERKLTRKKHTERTWLYNFVGFAGEDHEQGERKPSTEWPFQGFRWTDHEVGMGDSAQYRVVPVVRAKSGELEPLEDLTSEWSDAPLNPNDSPTPYWAYFNRGYVMSQFMARYLAEKKKSLDKFKETIRSEDDQEIRGFLSGDLRLQMLKVLDDAREGKGEVYAALFELGDDELIGKLAALKGRAHVVLANGSIKPAEKEKEVDARVKDENEKARAKLIDAKVDVEPGARFTAPKPLGHNKFLVVTDKDETPQLVWTGSTNWTSTGLCTQLNNGLLIRDEDMAKAYLEQWHRLREAKSEFPKDLVTENSEAKSVGDATVWFTRTRGEVDLTALREVIDGAKKAILFLMFQPGAKGLLGHVRQRQRDGLYVRGVVSTLPSPDEEKKVEVTMFGPGEPVRDLLDVVQPQGIAHSIAHWAEEVTRKQFLEKVGHAIIHSKVVVTDPFSPDATVITGSHNFSGSASTKNDENFIILRRNQPLAEAYLVNIFGAWRHYRSRIVRGHPFKGLEDSGAWLKGSRATRDGEAALWGF